MPRRRHIRIALQIAVVTTTIVFILSFFPGTPSSAYSSEYVDLSAINPDHSPLALKSSTAVAVPEATTTARAHSSTHGKGEPVQVHGHSSQGKSHGGKTNTEKVNSGKSDSAKSHSGETDTGKQNVENTGHGKTDTGKSHSEETDTGKEDIGNAGHGKIDTGTSDTGKTDSGHTDTGNSDTEETDSAKTDSGKIDSGKSDPWKLAEESKNSEQDETKSEEELGFGAKFENAGVDKPETIKQPPKYGHNHYIAPRKLIN